MSLCLSPCLDKHKTDKQPGKLWCLMIILTTYLFLNEKRKTLDFLSGNGHQQSHKGNGYDKCQKAQWRRTCAVSSLLFLSKFVAFDLLGVWMISSYMFCWYLSQFCDWLLSDNFLLFSHTRFSKVSNYSHGRIPVPIPIEVPNISISVNGQALLLQWEFHQNCQLKRHFSLPPDMYTKKTAGRTP